MGSVRAARVLDLVDQRGQRRQASARGADPEVTAYKGHINVMACIAIGRRT